ncbi:MAG: hypothetical protein ACRCW7_01975 [Cetobacterium sp.]
MEEKNLNSRHILLLMIDNMSIISTKKWKCPDKIAVEGGRGTKVWAKLLPLAREGSAESNFQLYLLSKKEPDPNPDGAK